MVHPDRLLQDSVLAAGGGKKEERSLATQEASTCMGSNVESVRLGREEEDWRFGAV